MEGKGLTKTETETFEGTFGFTSEQGGISCPTKAVLELEPGTTGKVKSFAPTETAKCTYSGSLDILCGTVDAHAATGLPWTIHATEVSEVQTIQVTAAHLDVGGTNAFCPDVTISGDLALTPDKAGAISSVTAAGTLSSNITPTVEISGTLNAAHSGTYGL